MPRRLQIYLRRTLINRKMLLNKNIWPIDKTAATPPEDWQGWPDGKKFALVLTHDVETEKGLNKCRELMNIDEKFGFRSSFNFVAGDYEVPLDFIDEIKNRGFEVGVHGLHHRGNIFRSRKVFEGQAFKINQFIKKWDASGFRHPSMYHNLDMVHALNIEYDSPRLIRIPLNRNPMG